MKEGLELHKPLIRHLDEDKNWKEQDLGGMRPDNSVLIIRYGAIGDMVQLTPLLRTLKKKGKYVCVNCHSDGGGYQVLKNNPYIDEFWLQKKHQITQEVIDGWNDLIRYWNNLRQMFNESYNLSESSEGALFAFPGRPQYSWHQKARHILMNHNYLELMYAICGMDFKKEFDGYAGKAYFTEKEKYKAKSFIDRLKKGDPEAKVILMPMSGSGVFKTSPWMDAVIARYMLKNDNTHIILTGDHTTIILMEGWQKEKRVHMRANAPIRWTLSLVDYVDCVVGPETGVTNLAGPSDTPSVMFCSHASAMQSGKYWKKHIALEPKGLDCYPCHFLSVDKENCPRDEDTQASMCSWLIQPDEIERAIDKQLKKKFLRTKKKKRKKKK